MIILIFHSSYGLAGWLADDQAVLIYDRFDIWQVDPTMKKMPIRLTSGRDNKISHRYLRLDREARSIDPKAKMLLHLWSMKKICRKAYAWMDLNTLRI